MCFLIDLFVKVGCDVSSHKDAKLVENTFKSLVFDNIKIFHTDQGKGI
ncbi:hypothetical protein [Spiroplasma poulsonii]|nr:hypothetical protein [Spiroplasma poulsonii]UNF62175.1 hypothetical protein MNU24_01540 [Spiroplasma poulsonii]